MDKIAIVTGGTSGIGLATVHALEEKGVRVFALSRHPLAGEKAEHIVCDIADEEAVRKAVDTVVHRAGRVDILVNCAGCGISGAFEFTDPADARRMMDVNLFGMNAMIRAVLPVMRAQGGGCIVNVSSVAAVTPIPFQTWYSISKAAVNALTMAVDNEVRPFGIQVVALLPGDIRTGFTAARKKDETGDDVYGGRIRRSVARMEKDEQNGMDPNRVGRALAQLALKKHPKSYSSLGWFYRLACVLARILPVRALRKLLSMLYGG